MAERLAYLADSLFDGTSFMPRHALIVEAGRVAEIVPAGAVPRRARLMELGPGFLAPGFVDLQVNGGGGILFNDDPSVETLRHMAGAHARLGTTALLPTLITDTPEATARAIAAAEAAIGSGVPGLAGLHLEGPHISHARKGAHDPSLIRPMENADLAAIRDAAPRLPALLVTVAPEVVSPRQIEAMAAAGVIVSLGHSDADYETSLRAAAAGARCVTHLHNAMSPLTSRAPGLVGAALSAPELSAGLIADGIHVHPATIAASLRGKAGPGAIFLVTDAMATAGSEIDAFNLNGRRIERRDGRLTLPDGTLAGADLDMAAALAVMTRQVGVSALTALAMATRLPAELIGQYPERGALRLGSRADFVHLREDLSLAATWIGGNPVS